MYVEFMGVTGVGKSSLAFGVTAKLRHSGHNVVRPDSFIHRRPGIRRAWKTLHTVAYVLSEPHRALAGARRARAFTQPGETTHLRLLFNWFYISDLMAASLPPYKVAILEQGVGQALYSFALRADRIDPGCFRALLQVVRRPDLVILVQAPADVVRERIRNRAPFHSPVESLLLSDGRWMEQATYVVAGVADSLEEQGVRIVPCGAGPLAIPTAVDAITADIRAHLAPAEPRRVRDADPAVDGIVRSRLAPGPPRRSSRCAGGGGSEEFLSLL
jgi:hypothetical protein